LAVKTFVETVQSGYSISNPSNSAAAENCFDVLSGDQDDSEGAVGPAHPQESKALNLRQPAPTIAQLNDCLIAAIVQNRPRSELESLIKQGAEVNCLCQRTNRTPIAFAVHENNHRVVRDLLDMQVRLRPWELVATRKSGWTGIVGGEDGSDARRLGK
jgi:hypothetical protein